MAITNSVLLLNDLAKTISNTTAVVQAAKSGAFWSVGASLFPLMEELTQVVEEAKTALPELKSLSPEDAIQLGEAAYKAIYSIIHPS